MKKTAAEMKALNASHAQQERLRKERRAEQEANVARKRARSLGTAKSLSAIDVDSVDSEKLAVGETSSEEGDSAEGEWDDGEANESSASEGSLLSETNGEGVKHTPGG